MVDRPVLNFVICQDTPIELLRSVLTNNLLYYFFTLFGSYKNNVHQVGQIGEDVVEAHPLSLTFKALN